MTAEEYEEIYRQYHGIVEAYVKRRVEETFVQDILQEVFFTVWKKQDQFSTSDNKTGWLINTAKYKIKENRRYYPAAEYPVGEESIISRGQEDTAMQLAETILFMEKLLKPAELRIFWEYYYLGYGIDEIAAREKIDRGALRMRLYRIKKRILQYRKIHFS